MPASVGAGSKKQRPKAKGTQQKPKATSRRHCRPKESATETGTAPVPALKPTPRALAAGCDDANHASGPRLDTNRKPSGFEYCADPGW